MGHDATGPLAGVRVLDLSRTLAGAHATTILADLGAEVMSVEPTEKTPGGIAKGGVAGSIAHGIDGRYNYECRSKKSIALNLKEEQGKQVFYELVRHADVVVENYRPGVTKRQGVDYDSLRRINPRIIYCSVTGFGEDGPYAGRLSWDMIAQAFSGMMSITGEPDRPPVIVGFPIIDTTTAMTAAQAIMAALLWRERTGEGQRVQTSLAETALSLLSHFPTLYHTGAYVPGKHGSSMPFIAVNGAFETRDGYVFTGVIHQRMWQGLCRALGREDLTGDPRFATEELRMQNKATLRQILHELFRQRTTAEWVELLNREDVAASAVNTLDAALNDPQTQHLEMVVDVMGVEGKPIKMVGVPYRFSAFPRLRPRPAHKVGEDTQEVLTCLLGYSEEQLQNLAQAGAIKALAD